MPLPKRRFLAALALLLIVGLTAAALIHLGPTRSVEVVQAEASGAEAPVIQADSLEPAPFEEEVQEETAPGRVALLDAEEVQERAVFDEPIPDGYARLVLDITGLPQGDFAASLGDDTELFRFNLRDVKGKESWELAMTTADARDAAYLDVLAGRELVLTFTWMGHQGFYSNVRPRVKLQEGTTTRSELALGMDRAVKFRIVDLPCGLAEGLSVSGGRSPGAWTLPGQGTFPCIARANGAVDAEGNGWWIDGTKGTTGPAKKKQPALNAKWGQSSIQLDVASRTTATETGVTEWTLAPQEGLVVLRSALGTSLEVEYARVTHRWNGGDERTGPLSHLHGVRKPAASRPFMTVFVDGARLGSVRVEDVLNRAERCVSVEDLPFLPPDPNLEVTVSGVDSFRTRSAEWVLSLYPSDGVSLFKVKRDWAIHEQQICSEGDTARNARRVGTWEQEDGGVLTATAWVSPGEYWVSLNHSDVDGDFVQLAPLRIGEGRRTVLQLDAASAQTWFIVPRTETGRAPRMFADEGSLVLRASSSRMGTPLGFTSNREGYPEPPFALVRTFDGQPDAVLLSNSPGANGMVVPLRAAEPHDKALNADLIVEVPSARRVYVPFKRARGGRISGYSDSSDRAMEDEQSYSSIGHRGPSTVQLYNDATLGVILRGENTTGVVIEQAPQFPVMVRDWFFATRDGVELVGDGRGREVEVTSALSESCVLVLFPKDEQGYGYLPQSTGQIPAGATLTFWMPDAAKELRWYRDEPVTVANFGIRHRWAELPALGKIADLSGPTFVVR